MSRKGLVLSIVAACSVLALAVGCQQGAAPQPTPKPAEQAAATPTKPAEKAAATATKPAEKAAEKPVRGGTLRLAFPKGDPNTLDAQVSTIYPMNFSIYDLLIEPDVDGNLTKGGLFKDWSISGDGKTVTFKLRERVKFQDGTDFDAAAVKWGIERIKDPASKSVYRTNYDSVASVEVVDGLTVRFNLKEPDPLLLLSMTLQGGMVASPAAVQKWGQDFGRHPVGTGPFQFVEWVSGDHITLKRFEGYWKKDQDGNQLPYLDQLVFQLITEPSTAVANLRTGQVQVMATLPGIPGEYLQLLKNDPNLTYGVRGTLGMHGISMNTRRPPFDNRAVRQAVALAVDRQGMAATAGVPGAEATVAASALHPMTFAYDAKVGVFPARDLTKAKAKMAEAGYPAGGLKVKITSQADPTRAKQAEILKANLVDIGIDGDIEILADALYNQRVAVAIGGGDYQITPGNLVVGLTDPGYVFSIQFHGEGVRNNFGPWSNPQANELIDKAGRIYDQKERTSLYQEAAKIIAEEMPFIPTHVPTAIGAWNKKVRNFVLYSDFRERLREVWLAQ